MSLAANNARSVWIILCLGASGLLFLPAVRACSVYLPIWGIRSKPADPLFRFVRNGKAGYIDSTGKIIIQPILAARDRYLGENNFGGEFHEGLVAVKDEGGYRYLDHSGTVVFRTDAWNAGDFSEGLAPASQHSASPQWGFIDRTGRFVIPAQYSAVDPFSEGLARVSVSGQSGSTGYIDGLGNFVIPPRLTYGFSFHEGRAAVVMNGPCQIINDGSCGRAEFRPMQTNAPYDCRYVFIDKSGKPVSDLRFDDAQDFSDGLAPVRVGREWGYVDKSGEFVISPKFEFAAPFSEGLAAVRQKGKAGFIDRSGGFVIPPQFDFADSFSDNRAIVLEVDGLGAPTYRFIDRAGKEAFPGKFAAATSFSYGLADVALELKRGSEGRFAWINAAGKPVFTYSVH